MKPNNVVVIKRCGEIYIGKRATENLGISGWKWLGILIEAEHIFMRICKTSPHEIEDHAILLSKKSNSMRGSCRKFTDKMDFGAADSIDLPFVIVSSDNECVTLKIDRPSCETEKDVHEREEKGETIEVVVDKAAQAEVARWIRNYGCDDVSCNGVEQLGRFDGVVCPLNGHSDGCGRANREEMISAEKWLISNGYPLYQEKCLGTVSKPAEKQLDIWNLTGSKPAKASRTRPLPDGLPEWLRGPLSRGEQVRVLVNGHDELGWAIGAYIDKKHGNNLFVSVLLDVGYSNSSRVVYDYLCEDLISSCLVLKPANNCLTIAKKLKISLSPMQISAIVNGGVPPEGHSLPDEMFE